ncbi:MAG TPA: hypothetical protein VN259_09800 [Xanthomonadales bacterium]|nr:hypothetical protein [Xanthomonadales bacterium]
MANVDKVCYLNLPPNSLLVGSLLAAMDALPAKMQKAPPAQWIATIRSLTSKGVKQAEIDDCEILDWLKGTPMKSLDREEVRRQIAARQVTIKEVTLGSPAFSGFSHKKLDDNSIYRELLYVANSERANMEDRIEELEWELEQYAFEPERLAAESDRVMALEVERAALIRDAPKAYDFSRSHFETQVKKHGKNLLAHGRELISGSNYLIEEVQSDWAQKGRRADWRGISRGPFVTETKAWAGLVARRMIQRAALNEQVRRVFWIRGSMSNGGTMSQPSPLDDFYLKTMPSIIDKALAGTGEKSRLATLTVGTTSIANVPCFDMTDKVRERLSRSQPLYSLAGVLRHAPAISAQEQAHMTHRARHMIGSVRHVRLVASLYDLHSMRQISGSYLNGVIQVALNARNPRLAMDHECFHFAQDRLLSRAEREIVERAFEPGGRLNQVVQDKLVRRGEVAAALQCSSSAKEASAHGFSLWAANELDLNEVPPVRGLFEQVRILMQDTLAWLRSMVQSEGCKNVEDVFRALDAGDMAQRAQVRDDRARARSAQVLGA